MTKNIRCPNCNHKVEQHTDYGMFRRPNFHTSNEYSWTISTKWCCDNCHADYDSVLRCYSVDQPEFWKNYNE